MKTAWPRTVKMTKRGIIAIFYAPMLLLTLCGLGTAQIRQSTDAHGVTRFENLAPREEQSQDYATPVAFIIATMANLGLPQIQPASVAVHSDDRSFRQGIADHKGEPGAFTAVAVTIGDKILVHERRLAHKPYSEQVRILAHELVHVVQHDLSDRRLETAPMWIVEGFAEWASLEVIKRLGLWAQTQEKYVWYARYARKSQLNDVASWDQWARVGTNFGLDATYGRAYLATNRLIEQKGLPAMIRYFESFRYSTDSDANFLAAFGMQIEQFERECCAER